MAMTAAKEIEFEEEENYLQTESRSLGIECKRRNEFNDRYELEALPNAMKEVYFHDYKTAYTNGDHGNDSRSQTTERKGDFMIWGRELVK